MDDTSAVFVGIDISKHRLDVHLRPTGEAFYVSRDEKGLDDLTGRLLEPPVALVVLAATGGFEEAVAAALAGIGLPLCIVNPPDPRLRPGHGPLGPDRCARWGGDRLLRRAGQTTGKASPGAGAEPPSRTRGQAPADHRDDRQGVQPPPPSH